MCVAGNRSAGRGERQQVKALHEGGKGRIPYKSSIYGRGGFRRQEELYPASAAEWHKCQLHLVLPCSRASATFMHHAKQAPPGKRLFPLSAET